MNAGQKTQNKFLILGGRVDPTMSDASPNKEKYPRGSSPWHVVLLVDSNERSDPRIKSMPRDELVRQINNTFGRSSLSALDDNHMVHCEMKRLLAGDYMWIARREGSEDQVLDCIIERKTFIDLVHTITTTSNTYAPLNRMLVQMKKLECTTLENKIILLEKPNPDTCGTTDLFTKPVTICMAKNFAMRVKSGHYPGFLYKQTSCINDTVRFLFDQHEIMRNKVQHAYNQALAMNEEGVSVDDQILKIPPFARIGTIENINQSIHKALNDSTFQYYLELRRIPKIGEAKTKVIMKRFLTKHDLQECMDSDTAIEVLSGLDLVGKSMALRIREKFMRKSPPPTTPTKGHTNKKLSAVQVTPDADKTTQKRKRAEKDGSFSTNIQNPKRQLFGVDTVVDSKFAGGSFPGSATVGKTPSSTEHLQGRFGEGDSAYGFEDTSSDDESLFEPIFSKNRHEHPPSTTRGGILASNEPNNPSHRHPPRSASEIIKVDDEDTTNPEEAPVEAAEIITID